MAKYRQRFYAGRMKKLTAKTERNLTFSDYFELNKPTKEIINNFGYEYQLVELELPTVNVVQPLQQLRETYRTKLPFISLTSEASKREFYVAPLLLELLNYVQAEINVEYTLDAGRNLNGTVDYLLRYKREMVVIEAKKGDLEKGFNQLAVELIALDKTAANDAEVLYGAVTLGDVWRFGQVERPTRILRKDINAFVVPAQVEQLLAILLGTLGLEA